MGSRQGFGGAGDRTPTLSRMVRGPRGPCQGRGALAGRASRHLPAAELQLGATAELVLAPLWVWIGVGEAPGAATLVGGSGVIRAIRLQAAGAREYFTVP